MIKFDMWYNDNETDADKIDTTFYPNTGQYRGNIYKNGEMIGDYVCTDSTELEKAFPQLIFNWD